jgi:hypothetical protein
MRGCNDGRSAGLGSGVAFDDVDAARHVNDA